MEERRRLVKIIACSIVVLILIIFSSLYATNSSFRLSVDKLINKEVFENDLKSIEINSEDKPTITAYGEYISVLSRGILKNYNKNGEVVSKIDVNIASPMMCANGKYLVIAENGGENFSVVYENQLAWQGKIDGTISKININQNGYVSVIVKNTSYKSVVVVFDSEGTELFKSVSASTYAVCADISSNNRYLAVGEVDYTGTIIKSKMKIISIELTKSDSANALVNVYESEPGEVITNVNYHLGNDAVGMFSNYIQLVTPTDNRRVVEFNDDVLFADIFLKNNVVLFEKQQAGLFLCDYQIRIINLTSKKESLYFQNLNLIKSMKTSNQNIILNFVNSVQVVTKSGWLSKNYNSSKEIKEIVASDDIVGIVYKDKIEIIEL